MFERDNETVEKLRIISISVWVLRVESLTRLHIDLHLVGVVVLPDILSVKYVRFWLKSDKFHVFWLCKLHLIV